MYTIYKSSSQLFRYILQKSTKDCNVVGVILQGKATNSQQVIKHTDTAS